MKTRFRFCAGCILVTAFLVAGLQAAMAQTRRALLVGINIYEAAAQPTTSSPAEINVEERSSSTPGTGRGSRDRWFNLDGCLNDVEAIRQILIARWGFKSQDIVTLKDSEATRERILSEFRKHFIAEAAAGDLAFFFYAGHGSQVRNTKTDEPSGKDQSIVPADSRQRAPDIRDKELARLFNAALDKGVVLTAIFDSCHSGSIARGLPAPGKSRDLPPDPNQEVADPPVHPIPEDRGALVISAAQDTQRADEDVDEASQPHGAFSVALINTLRNVPLNETAERIFLRTKAALQGRGRLQEPVIGGTGRLAKPLFGGDAGSLSGRIAVAVASARPDGEIELQGGQAAGLNEGCELTKVGAAAQKCVMVRVAEVMGMSRSKARLITGSASEVKPGDLFEVSRWVAPQEDSLRLWVPPASLGDAELLQVTKELAALRNSTGVHWIDDPTVETPSHVLSWTGSDWKLSAGKNGASFVRALTAKAVLEELASAATGRANLFVHLPPSAGLAGKLKLGANSPNDTIRLVHSPHEATYLLTGRFRQEVIEYAWVLPNATQSSAQNCALPVRTDWIAASGSAESQASAARSLAEKTQTIARIKAWQTLESPPDEGRFPYRLVLKNSKTGECKSSGDTVCEGEPHGLVLLVDSNRMKSRDLIEKRYAYVFVIDSFGKSTLLAGNGNMMNRVPYNIEENAKPSSEIVLLGKRRLFDIGGPFGVDTYVLLTSVEAIPDPEVLDFSGVRSRGAQGSPFQRLLTNVGAASRGAALAVPTNWSIQRMTIRSLPKRN